MLSGGTLLVVYVIMALVVPLRPIGMSPANAFAFASTGPGMTPGTATSPDAPLGSGGVTDPAMAASAPPGGPPPTWIPPHARRRNEGGGALVLGVLLVLVGGYLLARQFFPLLDIGRFWPMIVILIGVVLIATAFGRRPR